MFYDSSSIEYLGNKDSNNELAVDNQGLEKEKEKKNGQTSIKLKEMSW